MRHQISLYPTIWVIDNLCTAGLAACCLLKKITWPILPQATPRNGTWGTHHLGTSMLCLWGCGSRGCISLVQWISLLRWLFSLLLILCPALESNESSIKTDEQHSWRNENGSKKWVELFILTCVSNVLDMYSNNPCACLSMWSLIKPFLRHKTGRLLEMKSKGSHIYFLQDSHMSSNI